MSNEFKNKKISVIGIGKSGIAACALLRKLGAYVFISDSKKSDALQEEIRTLTEMSVEYETGGNTKRILETSMIVVSPGVPLDIPVLKEAIAKKIPLIGEIELAYLTHPKGWIAITGSNGKTTTTTLTGLILAKGKVPSRLAGNIGIPATENILEYPKNGLMAAEISSFQLETTEKFKPEIAAVLNLTPNHLDRYPVVDAYYDAKKRIAMNMTRKDTLIINNDDKRLCEWAVAMKDKVTIMRFGLQEIEGKGAWLENDCFMYKLNGKAVSLMPVAGSGIRGPHNIANQLVAILIGKLKGIEDADIIDVLKNFKGVEHRMEFVRELRGVKFYNDSKATTVESLSYALKSFTDPVYLIAGGHDKGSTFELLNDEIKMHCAAVILIGEATEKMAAAWKDTVRIEKAGTLEEAIQKGYKQARPGETVLLSPACASYDMFRNFEDRGRKFKEAVMKLC